MKPNLSINDVRPKLPFNINYGMADLSIKHILDPNWNITIIGRMVAVMVGVTVTVKVEWMV